MKALLLLGTLISLNSFATSYICSKFQDSRYEHYSVQVNTQYNMASVDVVSAFSRLSYKGSVAGKHTYSGASDDIYDGGKWELRFNEEAKEVELDYFNYQGEKIPVGKSTCTII